MICIAEDKRIAAPVFGQSREGCIFQMRRTRQEKDRRREYTQSDPAVFYSALPIPTIATPEEVEGQAFGSFGFEGLD